MVLRAVGNVAAQRARGRKSDGRDVVLLVLQIVLVEQI